MSRRLSTKAGIAMPLVLLLTAILGFTMLTVITSLTGLRRETLQAKNGAEFERAAMTAEARFMFLALTEPLGSDGLYIQGIREQAGQNGGAGYVLPQMTNPDSVILSIDDTPWRWREQTDGTEFRLAVQDEAGLVNIYQADTGMLTRLFQTAGLGDTDATNLANEMVAYNADPALHQPMRRPVELYRLDSAPALLTDRIWRRLADLIVSYPDSRVVNINTAPAEVLKIWFDVSDRQAEEAVTNRKPANGVGTNAVYTSPEELGFPAVPGQVYARSGGRLRFRFTDPASGDTYQSSLVLTPNHLERPAWIENAQTRHLKPQPDPDNELKDFPEIPRLAS